jgi:hypothetical protein
VRHEFRRFLQVRERLLIFLVVTPIAVDALWAEIALRSRSPVNPSAAKILTALRPRRAGHIMTILGESCLLLDQASFLRGLTAQPLKHFPGHYHRPDATGVVVADFVVPHHVERWARELAGAHAL